MAGAAAVGGAGQRDSSGGRRRAGARDRPGVGLPDGQGEDRRARSVARRRSGPRRGGAGRPGPGGGDPGRRQRGLGRRHRGGPDRRAGPGGPGVRGTAVRHARAARRPAPADRCPDRCRRGRSALGRSAARGPARGVRRRGPQGAAAGRGAGGAARRRGARSAVRRVVGSRELGRDRRGGRAGRRPSGAALRLRPGHRRPVHPRRHERAAAAGRRRPAGGPAPPGPPGCRGGRRGHRRPLAGSPRGGACMNPPTAFARVLVDELVRGGVTDAVLAPGSRSAPVALALAAAERAGRLRLHVRIDERTGAFLALGLAKASGRPVPVLTTSGTATAHLHAAVLEADASGVPLLALTADRPPELRATGANQTIEQAGLYGGAVRWAADVGVPEAGREAAQNRYWRSLVAKALLTATGALSADPGPVHLNLALREPLLPDDAGADLTDPWVGRPDGAPWTAADPASWPRRSVAGAAPTRVVVGEGPEALGGEAAALGEAVGWPVAAEPSSGAWSAAALRGAALLLGVPPWLDDHRPDRVLVVGRPTLSRPVNTLLADPSVQVETVAAVPRWADAVRSSGTVSLGFAGDGSTADPDWCAQWQHAAGRVGAAVDGVLDAPPGLTAARLARDVVAGLPTGALLVL